MNQREQRLVRRKWRVEKKNQRERKQMQAPILLNTPPASPPSPWPVVMNEPKPIAIQRMRGRKKVRKDRSKVYRDLEKVKQQLKRSERLVEKYKKRLNRIKQRAECSPNKETNRLLQGSRVQDKVRKTLVFHHAMVLGLRKKFMEMKSQKEKQLLSKVVTTSLFKKYRLKQFARQAFHMSQRRLTNLHNQDLNYHRSPKKGTVISNLKLKVSQFLSRDDNSRLKPGKKDTITRKGEKRQKRLLVDSLRNLHAKYLSERVDSNLSYALFCRLRPFHILHPSASDRETCLCKKHGNLKFKAQRLHQSGILNTADLHKLAQEITCSVEQKDCMYRDCNECASKQVESFNAHDDSVRLEWHEWKTKRVERQKVEKGEVTTVTVSVTVKNKESGTAEQLVSEFQDELQKVCKHLYNTSHQYTALRTLKENLVDEDVLVHVDFSENYLCKYESEIQSMHFGASHKQITLHTGVAYTKDATQSFCSISDSTKHGPGAIWAHLTPILTEMKTRIPQLTNVYFVTDGPTTQYRCKTNFYLLSTKLYDLGFLVGNWNFLEAGHGKGAPDGIGAAIKREADRLVSHGKDIMDSKSLVHLIEEAGTSIKLYEVTDEDICQIEKDIPDTIKPVQGTMKIHQLGTCIKLT